MKKLSLFFILFIYSASIYAETPTEIQGVWVPDVEESIALMKENMSEIDESGISFMRDRLLPSMKRTISKNQYVHTSGKREIKADISLKEKQGSNFVMLLTSDAASDVVITIIPKENGRYTMVSENPSDGSGNIVWKKQ